MKPVIGALTVLLAMSPLAMASGESDAALAAAETQTTEQHIFQQLQADYEQAMGMQYDEDYVSGANENGVTNDEVNDFLGLRPGGGGHGGGGHGGGGHGGGGHGGGGHGGGGHGGGGHGGGGHGGGHGGGGHGGYHGRPGWHEGHHWDHGGWHPGWWRPGFLFPGFIFIVGIPHGYWQCSAFNGAMVRFSAFGPTMDEAAYNALYDCGGMNPQAAGCYIPPDQCRFYP